MREMKLRMQVLQAARRLSRAAHGALPSGCNYNVGGGSLQERRTTTQVMLGV